MEWLEKKGIGTRAVNYKLRDWIFSRQRYWGEPIPLVHCPKDGTVAVPYDQLPLKLPEVKTVIPSGTGESPLAAITEWVNTTCPKCGGPAKRETNTMPQWAGSCWYYLRFLDPNNDKAFAARDKIDYWMPVDLYVGGAEHAVLHLLYARFWHKFLFDEGLVNSPEPFMRLINQGMILGEGGVKMSKSLGNVINPDDIVRGLRRGHHARLRDVHGTAGGLQALVHARHRRGEAIPGADLADRGASPHGRGAVRGAAARPAQDHQEGEPGHRTGWSSTRPSPR